MVERPLSILESHFARMAEQGNVTLCGCEFSGRLTLPTLRVGLEALRRRHPILRSRLAQDKDGVRCWTPSDDPIYYHLKEVQDARPSLSLAIEEQLALVSDAMQSSELQFRLVLITPSEPVSRCAIAMSFSHAVMDGLSRMTFINELLSFTSKAATPGFAPDQVASLAVLPTLIDMMGPSIFEKSVLPKPSHAAFTIAYDHAEKLYEHNASNAHLVRQRILFYRVPSEGLDRLKAVTKRETITLNSLFVGAFAVAVYNFFKLTGKHYFPIGAPANARQMVSPPVGPEHLGNFAIQGNCSVEIGPDDTVVSAARSARTSLQTDLNDRAFFRHFISNELGEQTSGYPLDPRIMLAVISNAGIVDTPKFGDLQLQTMYSGVANRFHHPATFFVGIHTLHGALNISFSFPNDIYDESKIAALCTHIVKTFSEA